MREKIKSLIDESLVSISKKLDCHLPADFTYDIETPKSREHGDLAVNLALKLKSIANKNPREIALVAKEILDSKRKQTEKFGDAVREIRVEGPGFLNFFLTGESRADILRTIREQNDQFGYSSVGANSKVLIEFVSANPTGPLTIAHGRQAAVGDTLANLLKTVGY